MMGGSAETHLIVVYLFYSPLKNMIGQKFSLSGAKHRRNSFGNWCLLSYAVKVINK
jgi:hypothetical protein